MKTIQLTQGKAAKVDDWAYEYLSRFGWRATLSNRTFYAYRNEKLSSGQWLTVAMHSEVMKLAGIRASIIDHCDGNGLNNQLANLRPATAAESARNRRGWRNTASGFKGVYRHCSTRKWQARITANRQTIDLGIFDSKREAALAYDAAAREHHGEFARLNFPLHTVTANAVA